MFNIGAPELILILVVGLLIFGPKKLPEMGKAVGLGIKEFKKAMNEIKSQVDIEGEIKRTIKGEPPESAATPARADIPEEKTVVPEVSEKPMWVQMQEDSESKGVSGTSGEKSPASPDQKAVSNGEQTPGA